MEQRDGRQHLQRWPEGTLRKSLVARNVPICSIGQKAEGVSGADQADLAGKMKAGDDDLHVENASEIRRKDFEEAVDTAGFASTTRSARNSALSAAWKTASTALKMLATKSCLSGRGTFPSSVPVASLACPRQTRRMLFEWSRVAAI